MIGPEPCPRCGSNAAHGSPGGLCPRCLFQGGLKNGSAPETTGGVLESLSLTGGPMPRVLLRDTENFNGPGPVVRPGSDEMPVDGPRAGRLQLLGEIARGGMGAVLKGRDNDLGRDLAVKVLLEKHAEDPGLLRRFVEEAQIAGQLQHPGVVPVYELGAFADRRPYFAMKLVKGRTLAEVMAERARPCDDHPRLLAIFLDIAQTIAYAHARGVIHRDLKPSNVMVGSFGEVQVMDWGLAKILPRGGAVDDREAGKVDAHETVIATARSGSGSDLDLSHAGSVLGTPSYMAPEQARGENDQLDERADVFALGSILCEILTGQPAFSGRTSGEILRKAARGDVSEAYSRLDACAADPELAALARAALAPEADDRLRDAGAIVDRLTLHFAGVQEKLRATELAHAAESARAEEAKRTAEAAEARALAEGRARRLTLALAASIMGLFAVGGGGYAWVVGQKAERSARVGRAVDEALADAARLRGEARSAPEGETSHWGEALGAARRADELARQGDVDDAILRRIAATMTAIDADRADAEARAAQVRADRDLLTRLEVIRGDRSEHDDVKRTDAEYAEAFRRAGLDLDAVAPAEAGRWLAGRSDPAELVGYLDDWVFVRQEAKGPEPAWRRLVDVARAADRDEWRDSLRGLIGAPADRRAETLRRLADDVKAVEGQPAASLVLLALMLRQGRLDLDRAAATLRRAALRHPGDFWAHLHLSRVFSREKEMDAGGIAVDLFPNSEESIRHLTAAVAIRPRSALAHGRLGFAFQSPQKWEEAIAESREAIRLKPDYSWAHTILGLALKGQGKLDEAAAEFREAIRLQPDDSWSHDDLGIVLSDQGKADEAVAESREAIRLNPDHAETHFHLGNALKGQGKADEAVAEYREAIRLKPDLVEAHNNLGSALATQGKLDEAVAEFREAIRLQPDFVEAHHNLGSALATQGKLDEAVAEYREAIRLGPTYALARINLGRALLEQGDYVESLAMFRKGHELGSKEPGWRYPSAQLVAQAERLAAMAERLPSLLKGDERPKDNADRLAVALMCYDTKRPAAAARFWADALQADPKLGDDRRAGHCYNAACAASLAAAGQGKNDPSPDEAARARLREQAMGWLKAELAAWTKLLESGPPQARPTIAKTLDHWRQDTDLVAIRDADALAKLPEAERQDWQALWAEVDALIARARGGSPK
jgi:tetratricopeptide (TPR) repeat protein/precorrin-6B methylase 2